MTETCLEAGHGDGFSDCGVGAPMSLAMMRLVIQGS